jgi:hypothetical protein
MSMAVGVKVIFELVAGLGALIVIVGSAMRGRSRDIATIWGAALVGLSGLVILVESTFGLLDANRIPSAVVMLLLGGGTAAGVAYGLRRKLDERG